MAGAVASGKSTLARLLAADWELPYTELDALYHGPQWQPRPTFRDDIVALAEQRPGLPIVWLSSEREVKAWAKSLSATPPGTVDEEA